MARTVVRPKGTEEGSPDWLRTKAGLAKSWAVASDRDVRQLVKYLGDLRQHDWSVLTGGEKDWTRLCVEVLGYDPAFLADMEEGVAVLNHEGHKGPISEEEASLKANRRPKGEDNNRSIRTVIRRGTNSKYIRARLRRDFPDIAAALARGEYKSARAAGIAAGIVKVPSPLQLLTRAWNSASPAEREQFITWVGEQNAGRNSSRNTSTSGPTSRTVVREGSPGGGQTSV